MIHHRFPGRSAGWLAVAFFAGQFFFPATLNAQRLPGADAPSPDGRNSPQVIAAFKTVVADPARSTVRILGNGKEVALGTIVGSDGWIITKASQLRGRTIVRLPSGKEYPAKLVGLQDPYDLALLKIEATGLRTVAWRPSKEVPVGSWLATTGTSSDPLAVGVVSVATRSVSGRDMPPVTNNSGFLGVQLEPGDKGVKIMLVNPGSAAAKAGLKAGDIIQAIDGKVIDDPESLINLIQRTKPGQQVVIKYDRDGKEMEARATLDKRPTDGRSDFQNRLGSELSDRRGGFPTVLQHDTVVRPNDCGGPLVDLDGKAIGVNIARAGRTESYAVPSEVVQSLLADMKAGKYPPPADTVTTLSPEAARKRLEEAKGQLKKAQTDIQEAQKKLAEARESKNRPAMVRARNLLAEAEENLNAAKEAILLAEEDLKAATEKK